MADEVDLHEPRLRLIPLGKGANRNLMLEQRPRLGAAAPAQLEPPPLRSEHPVDRHRTDRDELLPGIRLERELAVPLKHRDHLR